MSKKVLFEVRERSTDPAFQIIEDENGEIQTHYGATYNSEAGVKVGAKMGIDANGNTVLVGAEGIVIPFAYGRGEIALFGASDVVASSVFSGSSLGTALNWIGTGGPQGSVDGVIFDDTAGGVFDPASPTRITIPVGSGITRANFTCGISIPAQATGERWIRLVQGGVAHMSSAVFAATTTPTVQNIQLNTGWIDVTEGQYFELHLVQNSGVSITVAAGSYSSKGGSTFFRASFK